MVAPSEEVVSLYVRKSLAPLLIALVLLGAGEALARKQRTYVIQKGDTPAGVAQRFRVPLDELYRFNNLKPGGPFRVGDTLSIPDRGQVTGETYVVKPGDSIARIADFHGISQSALLEANGLRKGAVVRAGQELSIPHELRPGALGGHVVRKGDTLASIAKRHKVSIKELAAANKLTAKSTLEIGRTLVIPETEDDGGPAREPRKSSKLVKSGEKVAGGVRHTVQPGQSLWIIARAYNTTGAKIARANGFEAGAPLTAGKTILIPGAKEVVPVRVKGFVIQPVHFVSVWNDKSARLKLITRSGNVNQRSRRILSRLAGPKRKKPRRVKLLHPRLIHMLQRVAERFPGHTIEIISGVRVRKKGARVSKHNQGKAVDFRVKGVPREALYEYIKELPKVGAGLYPNSVFVHLDVRDKTALWTDYSGVGEAADYDGGDREAEALADAETE